MSLNFIQVTWRCPTKKGCEYTVRTNSFFYNVKYTIQDILTFIRTFALGTSLKVMCGESGVYYEHSGCDNANFIRDLFRRYVYRWLQSGEQLRGEVEIDESLFGSKVKHHRGKKKGMKVWIFGKTHFIYPFIMLKS